MSAIVGIIGPGAATAPVRAMLARMAARGADMLDVWTSSDAVLAVSRHAWECEPGFAGPALVAHERDCVCVSDASLYYRDDLLRALAAADVAVDPAAAPASLIIAAYRAWGTECVTRLEGDFAFILYDRRAKRVVAAMTRLSNPSGHSGCAVMAPMDDAITSCAPSASSDAWKSGRLPVNSVAATTRFARRSYWMNAKSPSRRVTHSVPHAR